jgi:hypothetical protein
MEMGIMAPEAQQVFKDKLERLLAEHAMSLGHIEISPGISFKKSILDEDSEAMYVTFVAVKKLS